MTRDQTACADEIDDAVTPLAARRSPDAESQILSLQRQITSLERDLQHVRSALRTVHESESYKLAAFLARVQNRLAPPQTLRRRALHRGFHVAWGAYRLLKRALARLRGLPAASTPRPILTRPPQREIPHSLMVTVVIPVYDRTDILRDSIRSILAQNFDSFELILACDGSPAQTLAVVQEFAAHPRVRVFSWKEQSGNAVKGRNIGIAHALGKYVAFHDSDDVADPQRLRRSVEVLESGEADVVYGGYRILTQWQEDPRRHNCRDGQVVISPECDFEFLRTTCVPCQSTVMARASALRAVGGLKPEMRYREDHEIWLRLAYRGYRFKAIPEVLTSLRLHPQNLELKHVGQSEKWLHVMHQQYTRRGPLKPRIAFVLPGIEVCGGVAVVCHHVKRLRKMGYEVSLFVENQTETRSIDWFPDGQMIALPISAARGEHFDYLIATMWTTAHTVHQLQAERRFYFAQSDEIRFYPDDPAAQKAARATYEYDDLELIVIARWMQDWLRREFGREAHCVPNGLDLDLFHPAQPLESRGARPRVLLEGSINVPFKGMENAFRAVRDLDCEVWCVSGAGQPRPEWRCDRFFEGVPMERMKHIYSSCDILLKMSEVESFCYPPLEMMACGGAAVVGQVTGIEEYAVDGENCLIIPKGDVAAARDAVQRLIDDPSLRQRLAESGLQTARRFDWDASTARLDEILSSPPATTATATASRAA